MKKISVRLSCAAALSLAGAPAAAQVVMPGDVHIQLRTVASGLTAPVDLAHANDGSGRLFVADQVGYIRVIDANGQLLPHPFLDLTSEIVPLNPNFDERGVLGLAFHPDYASNGRFFVRYSVPRTGSAGEPCFGTGRGCHAEVLAEFRVDPTNPNRADPNGTILFSADQPSFNHNGGAVKFGPDGMLYFTLGDGGGANDGLHLPTLPHGPIGNGQNRETPLGAVLRIDVDGAAPYEIPPDNPLVGVPGAAEEIWAYGLRNPWKFSFDDHPGGTGELWVADVGQNLFEEVNIVEKGGNYGWAVREGFHCFDPFNPRDPPANCPNTGPHNEPLLDPIAEYENPEDGIAVIGGFVYRGSASPGLEGLYIFGDWRERLFYIDTNGTLSDIFEPKIGGVGFPLEMFLLGIGRDADGELYALVNSERGPSGGTGRVMHISEWTCYADCVGNGVLNFFDFLCFQNAFLMGHAYADCDGSGVLDFFDFLCFQNEFLAGCP